MKIISIVNGLSNTSKTTTAINLTMHLAKKFKVLFIDLDPKMVATNFLNISNKNKFNICHWLLDKAKIEDCVCYNENIANFDFLCSSFNLLNTITNPIFQENNKFLILKNKLEKISNKYDFIIIDCPSSLGKITINAITSSSHIIVPFCANNSISNIIEILALIKHVKETNNHNLILAGILITQFDKDNLLQNHDLVEISKVFSDIIYKTIIYKNKYNFKDFSEKKRNFFFSFNSTNGLSYGRIANLLTKD